MNAFLAIIRKELRAITREKTIIIAIVIQLFIASFSSVLLIGLLSFYDPDSISQNAPISLRIGIVGDTTSPLINYLRDAKMRVRGYSTPADAERAFQTHVLDLILYVPPDTSDAVEMKMFLPRGEMISSFITIFLREPLKRYENYLRQERGITVNFTEVKGSPSTTFEFLYSIILPMLMFFPAFVAGSLVIDSLSEELETHTLETLWSAPLSIHTIMGAKITAALAVAITQCILWIGLLRLNHVDIQNIPLVLVFATLTAGINIVVCAFTALSFRDRERSQFLYALFILMATSVSYLFDVAPIQLLTRLATGDHYVGALDVAKYALVLLVLVVVLFGRLRKMVVV